MTETLITSVILLLAAAYWYYRRELSEKAQMDRDLQDFEGKYRERMP